MVKRINLGKMWFEPGYYSWKQKKFFFSKLIDGFIVEWRGFSLIAKLK